MKFFDCDSCPLLLKCKLQGRKEGLIKKYGRQNRGQLFLDLVENIEEGQTSLPSANTVGSIILLLIYWTWNMAVDDNQEWKSKYNIEPKDKTKKDDKTSANKLYSSIKDIIKDLGPCIEMYIKENSKE